MVILRARAGSMPDLLDVLFEDEHCLAVVKPAGQFVQGSGHRPARARSSRSCDDIWPRPIRDRSTWASSIGWTGPVSGVLLWAKTSKAARRLSTQFERRTAVKEYWAIVEPANAGGTLEARCLASVGYGNPGELDRLADRARVVGRRPVSRGGKPRCPRRQNEIPLRRGDCRHPRAAAGSGSGRRRGEPTSSASRPPCEACPSWATRPTVPARAFSPRDRAARTIAQGAAPDPSDAPGTGCASTASLDRSGDRPARTDRANRGSC